jgi:hypothetical protein
MEETLSLHIARIGARGDKHIRWEADQLLFISTPGVSSDRDSALCRCQRSRPWQSKARPAVRGRLRFLRLRSEILDCALSMCTLLRERGRAEPEEPEELARREVRTLEESYRLWENDIGTEPSGQISPMHIIPDRHAIGLKPGDLLDQRSDRLSQGMRVAALLAEGEANAEICHASYISPHTKLAHPAHAPGIQSRAGVGAQLLRG